MAIAHVTARGQFPVQDDQGATLFNVQMVSGDDDHLVLDVFDNNTRSRVDLPRGEQGVNVRIAREEFSIVYGNVTVAATPETLVVPPMTEKAMLLVVRTGSLNPLADPAMP